MSEKIGIPAEESSVSKKQKRLNSWAEKLKRPEIMQTLSDAMAVLERRLSKIIEERRGYESDRAIIEKASEIIGKDFEGNFNEFGDGVLTRLNVDIAELEEREEEEKEEIDSLRTIMKGKISGPRTDSPMGL